MKTLEAAKAAENFTRCLNQVRLHQASFRIVEEGIPCAYLIPAAGGGVTATSSPRTSRPPKSRPRIAGPLPQRCAEVARRLNRSRTRGLNPGQFAPDRGRTRPLRPASLAERSIPGTRRGQCDHAFRTVVWHRIRNGGSARPTAPPLAGKDLPSSGGCARGFCRGASSCAPLGTAYKGGSHHWSS